MKKLTISLVLISALLFPMSISHAQTIDNTISIDELKTQLIALLQQMIIELTKQLNELIAKQQAQITTQSNQITQLQQQVQTQPIANTQQQVVSQPVQNNTGTASIISQPTSTPQITAQPTSTVITYFATNPNDKFNKFNVYVKYVLDCYSNGNDYLNEYFPGHSFGVIDKLIITSDLSNNVINIDMSTSSVILINWTEQVLHYHSTSTLDNIIRMGISHAQWSIDTYNKYVLTGQLEMRYSIDVYNDALSKLTNWTIPHQCNVDNQSFTLQ